MTVTAIAEYGRRVCTQCGHARDYHAVPENGCTREMFWEDDPNGGSWVRCGCQGWLS